MIRDDKLIAVFSEILDVPRDKVVDGLSYGSKGWDSVSHMVLVGRLEEEFGIMLDTNDILDMSSVGKAREILAKYGAQPGA